MPTLRDATTDDIDGILSLWRSAGAVPSVSDDAASITRLIERDPRALVVADEGGAIVGTLIGGWDGWRATMYRLAVHPDHRRGGLARALVKEVERRLAEHGARRVSAIVMMDHEHATSFWRAAGYRHDDRVHRYIKDL